jgi:hypothetical protein
MAKGFQGAADGRIVMIGDVKKVFDKEKLAKLRERYLAKHSDAFWIDFGCVLTYSYIVKQIYSCE